MERSAILFIVVSSFVLLLAFSASNIRADDVSAAVNCSSFANETSCCSATSTGCLFINCTGKDNATHLGCHSNETMQNASKVTFCQDPKTYSIVCTAPTQVTTSTSTTPGNTTTSPPTTTTSPTTTGNGTTTTPAETTTTDNSTTTTPPANTTSTTPSSTVTSTAPSTSLHPNSTISSTAGTSTVSSSTSTTTAAPKKSPHGFDGASFIGGMVLVLGLFGIFFIVYKVWWKPRKESRYHSL